MIFFCHPFRSDAPRSTLHATQLTMPPLHAIILGIIQGITEFFPISSSGHLILVPALLRWPDQGLGFDTVLHLGTLAALVWFFRHDLLTIARDVMRNDDLGEQARSFCLRVLVAAVPALAVGYIFNDAIERLTRHAGLVAVDLAFWALVLFAADRFARTSRQTSSPLMDVTWKQAIAVGLSQPIALLPGTSRSGITMTAGLLTGLSREAAARFSFFVSIPVIAAAGGYGLLKMMKHGTGGDGMIALGAGFIFAALVGAWAIRFLISYVSKRRFDAFVYYRMALALVVLLFV